MSDDTMRLDPLLGWMPAIPEPYWFRHWLFWSRPGCLVCNIKFRNRAEWDTHFALTHIGIAEADNEISKCRENP